jgi:hypothetical protein
MTECTICAEKCNKTTHKLIACEYCDFEACQTCVKTYLLDKPEPKCMNAACDKQWTRKFLSRNLTATFINKEFRPHLSAVQFELEKSRLPTSQITLELENQLVQLRGDEESVKSQWVDLSVKLAGIMHEQSHLKARLRNRYRGEEDNGVVETERAKFVRACPANDCRGYLSSQWKCGLCNNYTCPDCHEVKGERTADHTCDPNMLASAQAIAKDSKNCPNCSAMIFRIAGCNHMFCTSCHTGFDWKTGKIIRGAVGNPHYYDYISQRNGNGAPENPTERNICGDDAMTIIQHINRISGITGGGLSRKQHPLLLQLSGEITARIERTDHQRPLYAKYVSLYELIGWMNTCMRNISHTQEVLLVNTMSETNEFETMETLRVRYLRKQIDDDQFRMSIQKQTQKSAMKREYREIIGMANQAAKDIISRVIAEIRPPLESLHAYVSLDKSMRRTPSESGYINDVCDAYMRAATICDELHGLCEYVHEHTNAVVKTYHSSAAPYRMGHTANVTQGK